MNPHGKGLIKAEQGINIIMERRRKMKTIKNVQTTLEVELTAQDIDAYIKEKNLIPPEWNFYSVDVIGSGISQGAKLIIKHTEAVNK